MKDFKKQFQSEVEIKWRETAATEQLSSSAQFSAEKFSNFVESSSVRNMNPALVKSAGSKLIICLNEQAALS